MKDTFAFPFEQRKEGGCLVCPCCNEMIAGGAAHVTRAEQEVCEHCARKFDLVMKMKPELEKVFGGVPQQVLEGTDLMGKLSRAFTIGAIRKIVLNFCAALKRARRWLKEQFEELALRVTERLIPIGQKFKVDQQEIMKYLAV